MFHPPPNVAQFPVISVAAPLARDVRRVAVEQIVWRRFSLLRHIALANVVIERVALFCQLVLEDMDRPTQDTCLPL